MYPFTPQKRPPAYDLESTDARCTSAAINLVWRRVTRGGNDEYGRAFWMPGAGLETNLARFKDLVRQELDRMNGCRGASLDEETWTALMEGSSQQRFFDAREANASSPYRRTPPSTPPMSFPTNTEWPSPLPPTPLARPSPSPSPSPPPPVRTPTQQLNDPLATQDSTLANATQDDADLDSVVWSGNWDPENLVSPSTPPDPMGASIGTLPGGYAFV